jgi:hypothetical protein
MSKPSPTPRRASAAVHLRQEIERAEADGVARTEMTLKLTYGDVHQLKRDPDVALADISFADGVMRYLGVKVEQGGVAESSLQRPDAS